MLTSAKTANNARDQSTPGVKYGELVVLGYNGCLPGGNRGRKRSKFVVHQRYSPNGVKHSNHYTVKTPYSSQAVLESKQHCVSYKISSNESVIVEYMLNDETDMFQVGRSSDKQIDFVILDTIPENKRSTKVHRSTVSRFACRVLADRSNPKIVRLYAAAFDSCRNILLGERPRMWQRGLTTSGVFICHPKGTFLGGDAEPGKWREVSVGGNIFALRPRQSAQEKSEAFEDETNVLQDGTLIDLCGVTLLWRSAECLEKSPTMLTLETLVDELNSGRPQCPVGLNTLVIPREETSANNNDRQRQQPYVYLNCGHVQGHHDWGREVDSVNRQCPMCLKIGPAIKICMGLEPAFFVDIGPPSFVFNPCGHMATEKTVKFWANVPIPHGTNGFEAMCPFCATPLNGSPGYVRLIFQDNID